LNSEVVQLIREMLLTIERSWKESGKRRRREDLTTDRPLRTLNPLASRVL
jgi:hypothetical protein